MKDMIGYIWRTHLVSFLPVVRGRSKGGIRGPEAGVRRLRRRLEYRPGEGGSIKICDMK